MITGMLSYMGMYNYDGTLFDGWQLPDGVELETLKPLLFMECAELEALYPVANIFKQLLQAWSTAKLPSWERVAAALAAEYSPIENTDKYSEITDNTTTAGTDGETWEDSSTGSSNGKTQVNAYDGGMVDHDSNDTSGTSSGKHTGNKSRDETVTYKHSEHTHGNIGVTTNQSMIKEEIDLRKQTIYTVIIADFITDFCIRVY